MRRVRAVSCEGSCFLGASGALFSLFSLFSCSSSSMSANPIGRVRDRDRRELLLSLSLSLFARGVGCVAEIVVVDSDDAKRRGLHAGIRSLLVALVFLRVK